MAKLTKQQRASLPKSDFAIPKKAPKSGSYPIHDRSHALAALRLVGMHGSSAEKATVRRKVCSRYPDISSCKKK